MKAMKKFKIKWVDSWKDIPGEHDSSLHGFHQRSTDTIYAIRGITSEADVEHEKYHSLKNHPDKPREPRDYARQELEATKYAYDNIGKPARILGKLRAIFNDLALNVYNVKPKETLEIIREELFALDPPEGWINDFGKIEKEFTKVYGK